jgi:hypothetical protein
MKEKRTPQECFIEWLEIRNKWEQIGKTGNTFSTGHDLSGLTVLNLNDLRADIWHSALLHRLLEGKEPLEFPPPLAMSYPNYELAETGTETYHNTEYYHSFFFSDIIKNCLVIEQAVWHIVSENDCGDKRCLELMYRECCPHYEATISGDTLVLTRVK